MKKLNKWDSRYRLYDQLKVNYFKHYIYKKKSMHVTDKLMPYIYFQISKAPGVALMYQVEHGLYNMITQQFINYTM